jgi:hypothetical protein
MSSKTFWSALAVGACAGGILAAQYLENKNHASKIKGRPLINGAAEGIFAPGAIVVIFQ